MILFIGYIGGDWSLLHRVLDSCGPEITSVVQTGGFGVRSEFLKEWSGYGNPRLPVYFVDAPIDDMVLLERFSRGDDEVVEIEENVFYLPKGCLLELEDTHILCFGSNGSSIEKMLAVDKARASYPSADIVVSDLFPPGVNSPESARSSDSALTRVFPFAPEFWVAGGPSQVATQYKGVVFYTAPRPSACGVFYNPEYGSMGWYKLNQEVFA